MAKVVGEIAHLASLAFGARGVKKELFLRGASGKVLPEDFVAFGVWERQRVVLFDNRILDADAPSRFNCKTLRSESLR